MFCKMLDFNVIFSPLHMEKISCQLPLITLELVEENRLNVKWSSAVMSADKVDACHTQAAGRRHKAFFPILFYVMSQIDVIQSNVNSLQTIWVVLIKKQQQQKKT